MAQAPDLYAQRLLAERARREAARKAAASAPQRKPQIGMPSKLGQMASRQPSPDRVGQVRQAITQGVDYAGNFLAQGRAPEIGGAVRSMVEPVAQFPVTAVTDPLRAANEAQQALDPAYAMARGLTTTRLGAQDGNLGDMAAGVTEMGLAGLSFVPGGAAVKGARAMPPAPIRRPPPIGQPNVLAPPASRGPILNQLAPEPKAKAPKPLQKAQAAGYEGADIGEAQEWVQARSKGLDMSQAGRLKRAEELGFDTGTVLYHGTEADFTEFKPSTYGHFGPGIYLTDSPRAASAYGGGETQNIMPVYVSGKIATQQAHDFFLESALRKTTNEPRAYEIAAKMMQKNGYAGFKVPPIENYSDDNMVILFNPSNIRSTNAAFDPASKESANILATPPEVGGAFVGGALGATQGETPEERARNALLGAAGGAVGGRMARGMTPDKTRMGSNLGNVLAPSSPQGPKPNPMGFYSQLEATVTRPNTPGKATGEAWASWLKSQPGVKAEELEATGVTDWLRAKEGQVSRADVENYVRNNGVQVEEITKKANGQSDLNVEEVARQLFDESWETNTWDDWLYEARIERLQELFDAQPQAKKEEWLDLGGEDPELLSWAEETFGRRWTNEDIFSPEEIRNIQDEAWSQARRDYEDMAEQRIQEMRLGGAGDGGEGAGDTKFSAFTLPGGKNYTELMLTLPTRPSRVPQSMNELTPNQKRDFIRFNDRNAEVQDIPDNQLDAVIGDMELGEANFKDFTQRGMKILPEEAYRSSHWDEPNVLAHVRFKERTGPNGQRILALEEVQSDWHQAGRKGGYKKDKPYTETDQLYNDLGGGGSVPDAPFKDNKWAALAMKRVVKYAADNGFDGVAWIPGNIQNGKFHNATDKRADFYDKIFVNIANDIGKKSGAKAQRLTLDTAPSGYVQATDFHYLPLTPDLRQKAVEQGFPLFSVGAVGAGAAMTGAIRPPERKKPPGQRPRG